MGYIVVTDRVVSVKWVTLYPETDRVVSVKYVTSSPMTDLTNNNNIHLSVKPLKSGHLELEFDT